MKSGLKAGVIGVGHVGATTVYTLMIRDLANEIVLIDPSIERATGSKLDIENGGTMLKDKKIRIGSYDDLLSLDYVVITAGVSQATGKGVTRLTGMSKAYGILGSIAKEFKERNYPGLVFIASNPLDIMTYCFLKESGLDKRKVIGSGTYLDTSRYIDVLEEKLQIPHDKIEGFVLGEHGNSSFPLFSQTTIDGKPLLTYLKEKNIDETTFREEVTASVRQLGNTIVSLQGSTYYGISVALSQMIKAAFNNEDTYYPLSVLLEGEYGIDDVCISVPVKLSENGIEDIKILDLPANEKEALLHSANFIKSSIKSLQEEN